MRHGADALGFVFWRQSPRHIDPPRAAEIIGGLPAGVMSVGVFVNDTVDAIREIVAQTGIPAVQLHGDEPAEYAAALDRPVMRAIRVEEAEDTCPAWPVNTTFLVDATDRIQRGGTGKIVDWIGPRRWPGTDGLCWPVVSRVQCCGRDCPRGTVRRGCVIRCRGRARPEEFGAGGALSGERTECLERREIGRH